MLFSSIVFILYFLPIVLVLYYLFSFSRLLQNILLFVSSIVFYSWGETKYAILMCASILLNTFMGYLVDKFRQKEKTGKWLVAITVACNLAILYVFKYLPFTIRNINSFIGVDITVPSFVLPLGISFYTFQAISYVVDVYRGDAEVEKNPFYVGLYIAFFPQLIAGPIVRYNTIAEQIRDRKSSIEKFSVGCCRFLVGFEKKILLANNFALVADKVFELTNSQTVPASLAWLGAIAYTLQIYFDFSAYSVGHTGILQGQGHENGRREQQLP